MDFVAQNFENQYTEVEIDVLQFFVVCYSTLA